MKDSDFGGLMNGLKETAAHVRGDDVPGLVVHIRPKSMRRQCAKCRAFLKQHLPRR
jgi:hypothetical protein